VRYLLTLALLTSLPLATARPAAGPGTLQRPPDKPVRPGQVLRLTLEAPAGPLVLDRAISGQIPIRLWAENLSTQPVLVCLPVDGSLVSERDPRYIFRLVDQKGREVPRSTQEACPWQNNLHARDFVTLRPGQKIDLLKPAGAFGQLTTYLFPNLQPGEYTLTLTYVLTGEGKIGGKPAGQPDPRVSGLLQKALRGEVTSNAVKLRFIPAPGTDELIQILEGTGTTILEPADVLLILGHRREPRGYRVTLASLSNKDRDIREAAAFAMREYAAAYSVGQLKDKEIIPPELIEALNKATRDPDQRVRQIAGVSLRFAKEYLEAVKAGK
jgi:hypothetical protein